MSIPFGDVAGKRTSFTLVGDLHRVQSQCLGLVFNRTKPVKEGRNIQIESIHVWSILTVYVFPLLARLVAVGFVWNAWKIFIPTQTRHHLISLPHTTLEIPSHCHHLERCNMSSHGPQPPLLSLAHKNNASQSLPKDEFQLFHCASSRFLHMSDHYSQTVLRLMHL